MNNGMKSTFMLAALFMPMAGALPAIAEHENTDATAQQTAHDFLHEITFNRLGYDIVALDAEHLGMYHYTLKKIEHPHDYYQGKIDYQGRVYRITPLNGRNLQPAQPSPD